MAIGQHLQITSVINKKDTLPELGGIENFFICKKAVIDPSSYTLDNYAAKANLPIYFLYENLIQANQPLIKLKTIYGLRYK